MPRTITDHEMDRRAKMADAQLRITTAMEGHSLTAMEWLNVLNECSRRMIGHGLTHEWCEDERERCGRCDEPAGDNGVTLCETCFDRFTT